MEADLHAGFFTSLAGYNSLNIAKKTLDLIYKYHNINPNMRGYPSLDDRKGIVELKINELKEISSIFNIANLCFVIEEFNIAQKLYEEIVRRNFPSREIWNNLGVTHFYQALNKADYSIRKYIYPVISEQNTRANINNLRDINAFDSYSNKADEKKFILKNLSKAREYFDKAYSNDKLFHKSKTNYFISELLLNYIEPNEFFDINRIQNNSKISEEIKFEILGIYYALNDDRKRGKKFFKEASNLGSNTSKLNYDFMVKEDEDLEIFDLLSSIKDEDISLFQNNEKTLVDSIDLKKIKFRGLTEPYNYISTTDVKIRVKEEKNSKIYSINREKILIQESFNIEFIKKNNIDINSIPNKMYRFNDKVYKLFNKLNCVLVFEEKDKLTKIITFIR